MEQHVHTIQPVTGGNGDSLPATAGVAGRRRVDLRQLAVHREADPSGSTHRRGRRWVLSFCARYVMSGGLVLGFLGLMAWSARASLLPARAVTVMPALSARAEVQQSGTPVFQAPGWVEPRPTPIVVTALAEGVVERLFVVEEQAVEAGEPVAQLIDADARLMLEEAEAEQMLREAELARAQARLEGARRRMLTPVHLQAPLDEAEAALAKVNTELAELPSHVTAAEARQRYCRIVLDGRLAAQPAVSQRSVDQAQWDLDTAIATLTQWNLRGEALAAERTALIARRDTLRQQLQLMIDETREVAEREAEVKAAEAVVRQAGNSVNAARLNLDRMVVRSPQRGRVQRLVARPGRRVSGMSPHSMEDSSTIATLYDPQMLQLRTDVPLDQVPHVRPGQLVKIETEAVPHDLEGEVLFKTAVTDLQKNTLDVKVAVKDPPSDLKPDMLTRVTFLAAPDPTSENASSERLRLLVPAQLVESREGVSRLWVADQATGQARARTVKVGQQASRGDLVEVLEGLTEWDKLIVGGRDGLADGVRIVVTGEDTTLGLEASLRKRPSKNIRRIIAEGESEQE